MATDQATDPNFMERLVAVLERLEHRLQESPQPSPTDAAPLLTVVDVANLLRVSPKAVYQRVARREIPGVKRIGRSVLFHSQTIKKWLGSTQPVLSPERSAR